jgi:hypothetical protein
MYWYTRQALCSSLPPRPVWDNIRNRTRLGASSITLYSYMYASTRGHHATSLIQYEYVSCCQRQVKECESSSLKARGVFTRPYTATQALS